MKKPEHIETAVDIGNDSWELINFNQLPKNASVKRQVEALRADRNWQQNHMEQTARRIDNLISEIDP